MKDLKKIEELLEKYYNGESGTAEEEILREFLSGNDLPAHLEADAWLFRYFSARKEDTLPGKLQSRLESMTGELYGEPGNVISEPGNVTSEPGNVSGEQGNIHDESGKVVLQAGMESRRINLRFYWYGGVAAVILVLIGIFIDMQMRKNNVYEVKQDTFKDPYIAYNEARKVLYMVSEKLNEGTKPLKNIDRLDTGVKYMHPVLSFGSGIQHLEHLGTIEKTRKLISN